MALYKPETSSVYQCRFQVRGKTYRKSTGETDITRARAFETAYRKQVKADISAGKSGTIKLHAALDALAETKTDVNTPKHVAVLKSFFFSKMELHELKYEDVEGFIASEEDRDYANATINHRLQTLKSAIDLARRRRYRVPDLQLPRLKTTKGRTRILTDAEIAAIEAAFVTDGKFMGEEAMEFRQDAADIFALLCATGARFQEVSGLLWSQIDLKKKTLRLYRSKVQNEMAFELTDKAYAVLSRRNDKRRHQLYVFPNRAGTGPRGYSGKALAKAIDRAGLGADVTPHVLRHTIATKLHDAGMPIGQVQYVLGHASIQTTMRYIHTSKQAAATATARILNGAA